MARISFNMGTNSFKGLFARERTTIKSAINRMKTEVKSFAQSFDPSPQFATPNGATFEDRTNPETITTILKRSAKGSGSSGNLIAGKFSEKEIIELLKICFFSGTNTEVEFSQRFEDIHTLLMHWEEISEDIFDRVGGKETIFIGALNKIHKLFLFESLPDSARDILLKGLEFPDRDVVQLSIIRGVIKILKGGLTTELLPQLIDKTIEIEDKFWKWFDPEEIRMLKEFLMKNKELTGIILEKVNKAPEDFRKAFIMEFGYEKEVEGIVPSEEIKFSREEIIELLKICERDDVDAGDKFVKRFKEIYTLLMQWEGISKDIFKSEDVGKRGDVLSQTFGKINSFFDDLPDYVEDIISEFLNHPDPYISGACIDAGFKMAFRRGRKQIIADLVSRAVKTDHWFWEPLESNDKKRFIEFMQWDGSIQKEIFKRINAASKEFREGFIKDFGYEKKLKEIAASEKIKFSETEIVKLLNICFLSDANADAEFVRRFEDIYTLLMHQEGTFKDILDKFPRKEEILIGIIEKINRLFKTLPDHVENIILKFLKNPDPFVSKGCVNVGFKVAFRRGREQIIEELVSRAAETNYGFWLYFESDDKERFKNFLKKDDLVLSKILKIINSASEDYRRAFIKEFGYEEELGGIVPSEKIKFSRGGIIDLLKICERDDVDAGDKFVKRFKEIYALLMQWEEIPKDIFELEDVGTKSNILIRTARQINFFFDDLPDYVEDIILKFLNHPHDWVSEECINAGFKMAFRRRREQIIVDLVSRAVETNYRFWVPFESIDKKSFIEFMQKDGSIQKEIFKIINTASEGFREAFEQKTGISMEEAVVEEPEEEVVVPLLPTEEEEPSYDVEAILKAAENRDSVFELIVEGIEEKRAKGENAIRGYIRTILEKKRCRGNSIIMDVLFEVLEELEEKEVVKEIANFIIRSLKKKNITFQKEYIKRAKALIPKPKENVVLKKKKRSAKQTPMPPEKSVVSVALETKAQRPQRTGVDKSKIRDEKVEAALSEASKKWTLRGKINHILSAEGLNKEERAKCVAQLIINSGKNAEKVLHRIDNDLLSVQPSKQIKREQIEAWISELTETPS